MYIPVKVNGLSKPQISRLLNQHGVKLKLSAADAATSHGRGGSLVVHVSKDQHKKLDRAQKRNGAAVITFDPFQIHQHQHLRGKGTRIENQGFTGNDIAHFVGAHESSEPLMNKTITLNQVKDAGRRAKRFFGLGMKGKSILNDKFTGNDVAKFLGVKQSNAPIMNKDVSLNQIDAGLSQAKDYLKTHSKKEIKKDLINHGNEIKSLVGLGVKKRGRPRKLKGGDVFSDLGRKMKRDFENFGHQMNRDIHDKVLYPAASVLIHKGIPVAASTLGGIAGAAMSGGPIGGMAGGIAGEQIGNQIANAVGKKTGLGLIGKAISRVAKKRGRKPKVGVGMGQKKKARKPRKGAALKPAGYGI